MEQFSTLEMVGGALLMVAFLFFGVRSLPQIFKESDEAPKDWGGLVFPLVFVIALVVIVIMFLRA